jgi:hypothetical protein
MPENSDDFPEVFLVHVRIPAMVRGKLTQYIRHKGHLVRNCFKHKVYKLLLAAIAFDVEFGGDYFPDVPHILVTDMPLIWPGVNRYAIRPKPLHVYGGFHHIRVVAAATVPEGGDFVDVDGEPGHGRKITEFGLWFMVHGS